MLPLAPSEALDDAAARTTPARPEASTLFTADKESVVAAVISIPDPEIMSTCRCPFTSARESACIATSPTCADILTMPCARPAIAAESTTTVDPVTAKCPASDVALKSDVIICKGAILCFNPCPLRRVEIQCWPLY